MAALSVWALGLLGALGLGVAVLSAILLVDREPLTFALVLLVPLGALCLAGCGPGVGPHPAGGGDAELPRPDADPPAATTLDYPRLGLYAGWAAVYLAAVAWDLLERKQPATPARLLTFSLAGLGFALLALRITPETDEVMRALELAAVGVLDLLLGRGCCPARAGHGRRRSSGRRWRCSGRRRPSWCRGPR